MRSTCLGLALLLLYGSAATALEVVEFTDGRYLEVRDHEVQQHAIILEVDPGAWVVIPSDQVKAIGRDGETIYPEPEPRSTLPAGLQMWFLDPGDGLEGEALPLNRVWEQVCGV